MSRNTKVQSYPVAGEPIPNRPIAFNPHPREWRLIDSLGAIASEPDRALTVDGAQPEERHDCVSVDTLLARCQALEEELKRRSRELEAAKSEANSANVKLSTIEAEQQEAVRDWTNRLQASEKENELLRIDLEGANDNAAAISRQLRKLERDWDLNAPLLQIAVDLRVRFLERARVLDENIEREGISQNLIDQGNRAAHGGRANIDKLLFLGEHLPEPTRTKLVRCFQTLYGATPEDLDSIPAKMVQINDCEATLRTLTVRNKGSRPLMERQLADDLIGIIRTKYEKMLREDWDSDEDVKRRIDRVLQLTEEIVEADRQQGINLGESTGSRAPVYGGGQRGRGTARGMSRGRGRGPERQPGRDAFN